MHEIFGDVLSNRFLEYAYGVAKGAFVWRESFMGIFALYFKECMWFSHIVCVSETELSIGGFL